jgi:integrase
MANLAQKDGIYLIRFRFHGKEFKKSLKVRDKSTAEAARNLVELTIHRLVTGQAAVPIDVDPGDFILSGGTLLQPVATEKSVEEAKSPSTIELIEQYKVSQKHLLAESYHDSQAMHLRHLVRHFGDLAALPCDRVTFRDLDGYLKTRLGERHPSTVERERITLLQFYKWVVAQGYLDASPAGKLAAIRGGVDRPPFRTIVEIDRIIERGGLTADEVLDLWECLYLTPDEIASLLAIVRDNPHDDLSIPLHVIPAYTGMRRGEVLRLRWFDVDLEEEYITARSRKQSRSKAETVRRIDMHPELKKELIAWRELRPRGQNVVCDARTLEPITKDRANRCFWKPMNGTEWCLDKKRHWYRVGFHSYRHSFASNLAALGVDQRVIDEWMGHQTEAMRKRYRHLFPKTRRSAIESFSLASRK